MPSLRNKQRGFTLIEVMIAMMIFAMLSLLAYQILSASVKTSSVVEERTIKLLQIQRTFAQMERDLTQIILRRENAVEPILYSTPGLLKFTTLDSMNSLQVMSASDLQEVTWQFSDASLTRSSRTLPSGIEKATDVIMLREGVTSFGLRFYEGDWKTEWKGIDTLPAGVEVTIEVEGTGKIRRVFRLPDTLPATPAADPQTNIQGSAMPAIPAATDTQKQAANE